MAELSDRSLECDVCRELFNHVERRPKMLFCGHTFCLTCVQEIFSRSAVRGVILCPIDRKETKRRAEKLSDNHYVLSCIKEPTDAGASKDAGGLTLPYWCVECKAVADSICKEKHTIRNLRLERSKQIKPTLQLLEQSVKMQKQLEEGLLAVQESVKDVAADQVRETQEMFARSRDALTLLYDSLDLVGPEWDRAEEDVRQVQRSCEQRLAADKGSLQLLYESTKCELTVTAADGDQWRAKVDLTGADRNTMTVLGLLVHMQRANMLRLHKTERGASVNKPKPVASRQEEANSQTTTNEAARQKSQPVTVGAASPALKTTQLVRSLSKNPHEARQELLTATLAPALSLTIFTESLRELRTLADRPELECLELKTNYDASARPPPLVPVLPRLSKLRVLSVMMRLHRTTLITLLKAYSASLEVLWLVCHEGCDLGDILSQCGLRVSQVVLCRTFPYVDFSTTCHTPSSCLAQVSAVRRALPTATVFCELCHNHPHTDFRTA